MTRSSDSIDLSSVVFVELIGNIGCYNTDDTHMSFKSSCRLDVVTPRKSQRWTIFKSSLRSDL